MASEAVRGFVLASGSPRRLALLKQIGLVPLHLVPSKTDETPMSDEQPGRLAIRLAEAKARDALRTHFGQVILGADTVVACGRRPLGKPPDSDAARAFLSLLSGRRHTVYGGVCALDQNGKPHHRLVSTVVSFKRLTNHELEAYVMSGEWVDKAGGYAIQGRAATFVRRVNGSYSNVVGLPLYETASLLANFGVRAET